MTKAYYMVAGGRPAIDELQKLGSFTPASDFFSLGDWPRSVDGFEETGFVFDADLLVREYRARIRVKDQGTILSADDALPVLSTLPAGSNLLLPKPVSLKDALEIWVAGRQIYFRERGS